MTSPHSQRIAGGGSVRLAQSRPAQAFAVVYIVATIAYLYWRTFYTVNTDALIVSIPFLVADFAGLGYFLLFIHNLWRHTQRTPSEPPAGLSVDVFIATYNEDLDVLRPTIEAALAMDYPHRTYVLDDGRRLPVRQLCAQLGAHYLTRESNAGAKAGNINAALPRTNGEFIAFFDADHAPFKNFLSALLGYFDDPRVAIVQTPQAYYNLDSFQHGHSRRARLHRPWHEQSVFYERMMPGKDRLNAAFWCGSSAIIRREALEQAGGVDTRTVTEDMHTSMSIHAAGWHSVYDPRELAIGIAPDDASGFLVQRLRWAQGALQILRVDNPLKKHGLTRRQRIAYFASVAYVFEYVPRCIYLVTPIVALVIGQLPMKTVSPPILATIVGMWALGVLTTRMLARGSNPYLAAERYHLLKLTIMLKAALTYIWPRPLKFKVTPKGGDGSDHFAAGLSLIVVQLSLGIASGAAVVWAVIGYATGAPWELSGSSLLVTGAWALLNAGLVAWLASSILKHHHRRKIYRFAVDAPGHIAHGERSASIRLTDLSALGAGFESALELQTGDDAILLLTLGEHELDFPVHVLGRRMTGESYRYGAEFAAVSESTRRALVLFLYQQHAPAIFEPAYRTTAPADARRAAA